MNQSLTPSHLDGAPSQRPHDLVFADGSPVGGLLDEAAQVARSEATVLLTGETGTGKEVFARHIHAMSDRNTGPFIPVNCGAIPENLLEAELFGHVRGAFTGAHQARKGRVALAEGGTLFLDEVGELPLALQVKLLRVLQERVYEPVGGTTTVKADFRLVVATNRDLALEVQAGRFRQDLFYRLFVCPLSLPPLRARPGDVPALVDHFWKQRGEHRPFTSAALATLCRYSWPGNVRELENLVERISVISTGERIDVADIPMAYRGGTPAFAQPGVTQPGVPGFGRPMMAAHAEHRAPERAAGPAELPWLSGQPAPSMAEASGWQATTPHAAPADPSLPTLPDPSEAFDLAALLRQIEEHYIDAALAAKQNNKQAAARHLGLRRTTLVEKLRRREARLEKEATKTAKQAAAEPTEQLVHGAPRDRHQGDVAPRPRHPVDAMTAFAAASGVF
jgi:sigma-54 specific flagellar transcriptional regulator A